MKETLKSILLCVLMLLSIFFTVNLCFVDTDTVPSFFSALPSFSFSRLFSSKSTYSYPMESLALPRKYVVSDGREARACLYNSDDSFSALNAAAKDVLRDFLEPDAAITDHTVISAQDLRTLLSEDVIYAYMNFSVSYTPALFHQIIGVPESTRLNEMTSVRNFFILPAYTLSDSRVYDKERLEIFALDHRTTQVYRFELYTKNAETFIHAVKTAAASVKSDRVCNFALDMNLDTPTTLGGTTINTSLDSYTVIVGSFETQLSYPILKSENPFVQDADVFNGIVSAFGYNPMSIRKRVYDDHTLFIENDSSLKLYKNGLIEYTAVESGSFALTKNSSTYETLNAAIRFTENIWHIALPDVPFNACITSDLTFEGSKRVYTLDYYVEGVPIMIDIQEDKNGAAPITHAAVIEMDGGSLTSFRLFIRSYTPTAGAKILPSSFSAIDMAYAATNDNVIPTVISDLFVCYSEKARRSECAPSWAYSVSDQSFILEGETP